MSWLESIKLQAAVGDEGAIVEKLAMLFGSLEKRNHTGLARIAVCRHASIPGCFAIHLFWKTSHPDTGGSRVGLKLVQALKAHGLIEHSVWTGEEY